MTAVLLDGKALAAQLEREIEEEVARLARSGVVPGLAVVLVGDDPASQVYVNRKAKMCRKLGMRSDVYRLETGVTEERLLELIGRLNGDPDVHGILVQLPLPPHLSEQRVIEAVSPQKDVDGFHPVNTGRLAAGADCFIPCTPAGVVELLKRSGIGIAGRHAVVVGRSRIVGAPAAQLLLRENATVTVCHSRTTDLPAYTRQADILVVAAGRPGLVGREHVKPGAVVVDVGIHRRDDGSLCGDVRFEEVCHTAGAITPVPGGVGPMTIAMLMKNTVHAARLLAGGRRP